MMSPEDPAPPSPAARPPDTVVDPAFVPVPSSSPAPPPSAAGTVLDPAFAEPRAASPPVTRDGRGDDATVTGGLALDGVLPAPPAGAEVRWAGHYRLDARLGEGGMGVVYRGWDMRLNRAVAVKFMRDGAHASAEDKERFLREPRASARLRHPGIVAVFDVGEADGAPYFAMEHLEGRTLGERIRSGRLPAAESAAILRKTAEALAFAHQSGVIHRDLKPENIMVCGDQPKLMDFGLAKSVTEMSRTLSGTIMGTPYYMPPEQAAGDVHRIDARSDVYSLGVVLYELLTGQIPFYDPDLMQTLARIRTDEPVRPRSRDASVPADLERVCLKAMAKEPRLRYASAQELADDLGRFLEGRPVLAVPPSGFYRLRKALLRNRRLLGAFLAGMAGVAAIGAAWTYDRWQEEVRVERVRQARDRALAAAPAVARFSTPPDRIQDCARLLDHALALAPDDAELRLWRARARTAVDDLSGAMAEIDRALQAEPDHAECLFAKAWLLNERLESPSAALALLADWEARFADETELAAAGALLAAWIREGPAAASRVARERIRSLPRVPEHLELVFTALGRLPSYDREFAPWLFGLVEAHLAVNGSDARALSKRATALEVLGRPDAALADLARAQELQPEDWQHPKDAFNLCLRLDRIDEAETWLKRSEGTGLPEAYVFEGRSRLALARNDRGAALDWGLKALRASGRRANDVKDVAAPLDRLDLKGADLERVRATLREIAPTAGKLSAASNLALLYLRFGMTDECEAQLAEMDRLYPGDEKTVKMRARLLVKVGRYADAVDAWTRWIELQPHDPEGYSARGRAALALLAKKPGVAKGALRDLSRALQLGSADANLHLMRASLYLLAGKKDEALRDVTDYTLSFPLGELAAQLALLKNPGGGGKQHWVAPSIDSLRPGVTAELVKRGAAASAARDWPHAQRCFSHALYFDGACGPALVGLARCAARSDPHAAVLYLREAVRVGGVEAGGFAGDPDFLPLRRLPQFEALVNGTK